MNLLLRVSNLVYWVALSLWLAALCSAGIAAMNVFPTTDRLPLTLVGWPAPDAIRGIEHSRLLAGQIMNGVFFTADAMQFICVPLVLLTFAIYGAMNRAMLRKPCEMTRGAAMLVASLLFGYYAFSIAPSMNHELRLFWDMAKVGNAETAMAHRDAFNKLHPTADAILRANLVLVLTTIAASAWATTPHAPVRDIAR